MKLFYSKGSKISEFIVIQRKTYYNYSSYKERKKNLELIRILQKIFQSYSEASGLGIKAFLESLKRPLFSSIPINLIFTGSPSLKTVETSLILE